MMYGWNFGGGAIPPLIKARFAETRQVAGIRRIRLQGVTDTESEVKDMELLADNGHRIIQTVGPRKVRGQMWWAIYCG